MKSSYSLCDAPMAYIAQVAPRNGACRTNQGTACVLPTGLDHHRRYPGHQRNAIKCARKAKVAVCDINSVMIDGQSNRSGRRRRRPRATCRCLRMETSKMVEGVMAKGAASTRWSATPASSRTQFKKMSEDSFDRHRRQPEGVTAAPRPSSTSCWPKFGVHPERIVDRRHLCNFGRPITLRPNSAIGMVKTWARALGSKGIHAPTRSVPATYTRPFSRRCRPKC